MAKEKKTTTTLTADKLADEMLDTMKKDPQICKVSEELTSALEQKKRLQSDLTYFQAEKEQIKTEIEILRKNFGEHDTESDMARLKDLTAELEAITEGIELVQVRLEERSDLKWRIDDKKKSLPIAVTSALKPLTTRWQKEIDEKVDELYQMLSAYQEAFHIACSEQNIAHRNVLTTIVLRPLLPKIDIERFELFTDVFMTASMRGSNGAAGQAGVDGNNGNAGPSDIFTSLSGGGYRAAGLPPLKQEY
ncbi:hypothetical protein GF1_11680 [Desulfolithobacter dissulfuricans]|uniref:Uncharacterized protein n=1 Tax=Desulfolithobacter dissulfuricans TaxID=2795293 RepID=A0A915U1I1_9BACT|nr:hypothetical protein [Desulfolithobacter dissulfuricans]BCO08792.1 hypothetical protein GF1_11680 [Desulfolithobacter dissulfuricans]